MNNTIKDNQIAYIPHKGIYRWNSDKGEYTTLEGEDIIPADGTGVIHPIPITEDILSALGFKIKDGAFLKRNLKVDRNLQAPLFSINGVPINDFNDLYDNMIKNGVDVDFGKLLSVLSRTRKS